MFIWWGFMDLSPDISPIEHILDILGRRKRTNHDVATTSNEACTSGRMTGDTSGSDANIDSVNAKAMCSVHESTGWPHTIFTSM